MDQDLCQVAFVHEKNVAIAKKHLPESNTVNQGAMLFKLLGDPTRLKIILALNSCEMCVCDLAALLESTPSAISHQLRLLRTAQLVITRKTGKMVYYRTADKSIHLLLTAGLNYINKGK